MTAAEGLSERGSALWLALGCDLDTAAGAVALEACRTVDRLDRLDHALTDGGEWFDLLERPEGSGHFVVVINTVAAEARQQSLALAHLLKAIGFERSAPKVEGEATPLAEVLALVRSSGAQPSGRSS